MAVTTMAVAGLAVSAYGANKQSKAAKDAAKTQAGAADNASQVQWDMYQQNRQDQQPFYQGGVQAFDQYRAMLGLPGQMAGAGSTGSAPGTPYDPSAAYLAANPDVAASAFKGNPLSHFQQYGQKEGRQWNATAPATNTAATPGLTQTEAFAQFRNTPGYQFGLDEGNKSVQASAAARGGLNSGATLKALQRYGNDYADQQGYTPYMNKLAGLFGGAQTAAGQMGNYGQNTANQVGQLGMAGANARAQGTYDSASAWGNFGQQAAGIAGQWYGNRNTAPASTNWGAFSPNVNGWNG